MVEAKSAAAAKNGIPRLRPHVKTHKTIEGCIIQAGIDSAGDKSLADVIGFVASTVPELSMAVKLGCEYKRKPFTDVIFGIPICKSKLLSIQSMSHELTSATHGEGCIHVIVLQVCFVSSALHFRKNTLKVGLCILFSLLRS